MKCPECNGKGCMDLMIYNSSTMSAEVNCPSCNGTEEVTDKAESKSLVGHTAIKQLTLEELRSQFERKMCSSEGLGIMWEGYLWCARANNIIKE